jgi:uncharacterized protein YlxW (UPF0749 family)
VFGSPALKIKGDPRPATRDLTWHLPVLVASIVLGILVTLQFRTQRDLQYPLSQDSVANMSKMLRYFEVERNKLIAELKETRDEKAKYEDLLGEKGRQQDKAALELIKGELDKARMQAGLVPVKGPGVEVKLDDSLIKPGPSDDPYYFIVHDVDLQSFINELWAAGAEAIAVNDQRVVTSTSVRCVGPTVLVNTVRLAPPYVIRAIGAPSTLETALRMPNGVLASMKASMDKGVRVDIQKKEEMILPEFKGSGGFRYAAPVSAQ